MLHRSRYKRDVSTGTDYPRGSGFEYGPAAFEPGAERLCGNVLEEGFDDVTAVLALPERYRRRCRTTNSVGRLNEEIRRRERVIRIFPNRQSTLRLLGTLLIEMDEKWTTGHRYLDMQDY